MVTSPKRAYAIPKSAATQSPCPCGSPLLTHTSPGDAHTQFCFTLSGVSVSWCTQGMLEPSVHLWWEWDLILNVKSPLLPSWWGFFFALGHRVSPRSHSSITQPLLQCLPSCWGFSDLGHGVSSLGYCSATQLPLQCCSAANLKLMDFLFSSRIFHLIFVDHG